MVHELHHEELEFFDRAPLRQEPTSYLDLPIDRVFDELTEDSVLTRFHPAPVLGG